MILEARSLPCLVCDGRDFWREPEKSRWHCGQCLPPPDSLTAFVTLHLEREEEATS